MHLIFTGPGYECSDDADCSLNAMCTIIDEETECECTGGYEKSGSSCISKYIMLFVYCTVYTVQFYSCTQKKTLDIRK